LWDAGAATLFPFSLSFTGLGCIFCAVATAEPTGSVMLTFVVVGLARAKMAIHAPCQMINPAAIQLGAGHQ
jgi:hypothetical protein